MEEEKAAAYYDELVRKGGNAAKFKQGLGFGTPQSKVSKTEAHGSLSNFVKSASPGRSAALQKDIRIDGIREKLKKREDGYSSRTFRRSHDDYREKAEDKKQERTPELQAGGRKKEENNHYRHPSDEEVDIEKENKPLSKERRRRSHSYSSKSPSVDVVKENGLLGTPGKESKVKKSEHRERGSRSRSSGSRTSSERDREQRRWPKRDKSFSPGYDSRSRHRRSSDRNRHRDRNVCPANDSRRRKSSDRNNRSRRSCSRSHERRQDRSRSRSRSSSRRRDADRTNGYRRDSSHSHHESRTRGHSPSPSHRSSYNDRGSRREGRALDRKETQRRGSDSRGRYEDCRRQERSKAKAQDGRIGARADHPRFGKGKAPERDYSKLIPKFESMTPAEKVKAKIKLQLSETVVQDQAKGMSDEWERFDFNKDAPLDDDAKLDYFGDGTGAQDDTIFLNNTGSTFRSSSNQVTREAQNQAAHEAAIFGPPQGLSIKISQQDSHVPALKKNHQRSGDRQSLFNGNGGDDFDKHPKPAAPPASNVLSEQVIAMQQAGSWQERARRMKEAREGALNS